MTRLGIRHRYTDPITPPPPAFPELTADRPYIDTAPQNMRIDWVAAQRLPKPDPMTTYRPLGHVECNISPGSSPMEQFRYRPGAEPDWPLWTVTVTVASPRTATPHLPTYFSDDTGSDHNPGAWYNDVILDFYGVSNVNQGARTLTAEAMWVSSNANDHGWGQGLWHSDVRRGSRAAHCSTQFGMLTKADIAFAQINGFFPHAFVFAGPTAAWSPTVVNRPASGQDTNANINYHGHTPMGAQFGLPPEFVVPASWSPMGKWMAKSAQLFGFYVVDSTQSLTIYADVNPKERVVPSDLGGLISNVELDQIVSNSLYLLHAKDTAAGGQA